MNYSSRWGVKMIKKNNMRNFKEILEEESKESSIKSEKQLRDYMENKFKKVFGDKLDTKRMEFTIDGFIDNNKDLIEKGDFGTVVGKFNKSFGSH